MKIGMAGPVSLRMLAGHVANGAELPDGYRFAPMAVWIQELMARGHEVVVFTLAPEASAPRCYAGPRLKIHVGRYRARGRARDFFALERQDLLTAMRAEPCDIIHAHWTYEFALAALDSDRPVLVTAHDAPMRVLRFLPDPYRFMRLLMAWKVARRAPFMTAVSDHIARHYRRVFRYRGALRIIPNALGPELLELGPVQKPARKAEEPVFATVLCGWGPLKNASAALLAFRQVRRALPQARLLMFGQDYGPGEKAEQWARAQRACEGVDFAGMLPHGTLIERLRRQADVLVHPSLEESFGMAMAEAMALRVPVIAGEGTGGAVDLLDHGKLGLLVDVSSPRQIAAAMLRLANDPQLREQLGAAAWNSARQRFSSAAVFSAYENAYRQITDLRNNRLAEQLACSSA